MFVASTHEAHKHSNEYRLEELKQKASVSPCAVQANIEWVRIWRKFSNRNDFNSFDSPAP